MVTEVYPASVSAARCSSSRSPDTVVSDRWWYIKMGTRAV